VGRRAGLYTEAREKSFASAENLTSIALSSSSQPNTILTKLPGPPVLYVETQNSVSTNDKL
jgi:hypothetical protein